MRPPPLNYIRPHSVRDALVAAHESSDGAVYLAGGQDLLPSLNRGDRSPSLVVDLKGALDLGVSPAGPQWLGIGALTTHHQLSQAHASRSWSDAVSELGPLPVRTRATVGGHLAAGAPGDFWPTLLTALDGRVELVELGGRRLVAVAEALSAVRRGHGLVCGVLLPRSNDLVGVSRTRGYTPAANAVPRLTCAIRIVPDSACRVADARVVIGYLRARYYDPATGLFTTVDPLDALTRDPYVYAGNNSLNNTDPLGLYWGEGVIDGAGRALSSGAHGVANAAVSTGRFARNNYGTIAEVTAGGACIVISAGMCALAIIGATGLKIVQDRERYNGDEFWTNAGGDAILGAAGAGFAGTGALLDSAANALGPTLSRQVYPNFARRALLALGAFGTAPDGHDLAKELTEGGCP